ncbi:hypothetical protein [Legionella maceachernii]|uniref:Uncharacterized protein n=1 Tax=Legionella maceachernii TaxID=466 RepID=A0A0W0VW30_9GAMM|nr:hypothetical protein [Legionella maceachernii]KTD24516.1 hypothetical protein Lmac_2603 [Legionella maceachernii]SJZ61280.1 virulence-associated protein [Legionella maceachernii]SUP00896.1 type III effector phosphothreonine lyase [Legionella maceachernii]
MSDFSYETLNTTQDIPRTKFENSNNKSYEYYITNDSPFAIFEPPQAEWADKPDNQSPWKIHLNVNKDQLAQAWDLIHPFLLEQEVPSFKVTRLSRAEKAETEDSAMSSRVSEGAQITIYIPKGKEYQYNQLAAQIEQKLLKHGIQPGQFADSDKKIGVFASVRGAGIPGGEPAYLEATQATHYNPHHLDDPFVMQESQIIAQFTQRLLTGYLTEDYAQKRIGTAIEHKDPGMLTRLFDQMKFDGSELLANTRAAAEAGNLEGYLSQFARGCARQLFNDDLTDLNPSVKNAIGEQNYDKLVETCGSKEELIKKMLQATIALHTQLLTSAFEKEQSMTMEDVDSGKQMTAEQNEAFRKLSEQVTVPSENFVKRINPQVLLEEKFSAKATQDLGVEKKKEEASKEIEKFQNVVWEVKGKVEAYISSLQKWGILKDNSEKNDTNGQTIKVLQGISNRLERLYDQAEGFKDKLSHTKAEEIDQTLSQYQERYKQQIDEISSSINIEISNPREKNWLENLISALYNALGWGEFEFKETTEAKTKTEEVREAQKALRSSVEEIKSESNDDDIGQESSDEEEDVSNLSGGMKV